MLPRLVLALCCVFSIAASAPSGLSDNNVAVLDRDVPPPVHQHQHQHKPKAKPRESLKRKQVASQKQPSTSTAHKSSTLNHGASTTLKTSTSSHNTRSSSKKVANASPNKSTTPVHSTSSRSSKKLSTSTFIHKTTSASSQKASTSSQKASTSSQKVSTSSHSTTSTHSTTSASRKVSSTSSHSTATSATSRTTTVASTSTTKTTASSTASSAASTKPSSSVTSSGTSSAASSAATSSVSSSTSSATTNTGTSSVSGSTSSTTSSTATSSASSISSSSTSSSISSSSTSSSSTSSASATGTVCAGNSASNRTVWCDYDISTDYYDESPDTGVTVEYWFELSNITAAPNGVERTVLAINGSVPGPTIEANWGDTVVIHVTNNLANNGTTIHWHGIRQNFTNANDGVSAITQCPIAPGDSMTYTWNATQYGSSWYHSHWAMQAWDGIFGGIVIHGPATANYDHDLGSLFLNDWDERTADQLYELTDVGGPPTQQTGLINGTNTWTGSDNVTVGSRFSTTWESGSSYLLRVVNAAIDTHFSFTIDNHTLQVIASDFVPIVPYTTDVVSIGMGQRYDIIVTADQASVASDFWMRAVPDTYCSENSNPDDIKGIVHYGDSTGTPTTSAWTITENDCNSEPSASIVPYLSLDASSSATVSLDDEVEIGFTSVVKWYLGDVSMVVNWTDPTSLLVINNDTSYQSSYAVTTVPTAGEWTQLTLESTFPQPHPIHLHGHDFFTLASGTGTYADAAPTLNTANPPRRDVDMLPASGYLVIAFKADNPGVWLCHCHIGWHTGEGFALQFVERETEIAALYNATTVEDTCSTWSTYQTESGITQDDSGI